jgi:murein DD-endopeptidase MepM/ murein hydrolase activator NlpD
MRSVSSVSRRPLGAVAVTCVVALGVAACSSDSSRFDQPMFHGTSATGSISPQERVGVGYGGVPQGSTMGAGSGMGVQQQSLAAPSQSYPGQSYPSSAGYQPPVSQPSVQPASWQSSPATQSYPGAPGSTASVSPSTGSDVAIHVGQGETLYSISRRYGIPVNALMQANGISDPTSVKVGQRLVVPRYSASQSRWVSNATPAPHPAMAQTPTRTYSSAPVSTSSTPTPQPVPAGSGRHTVQPGETLYSISRRYRVPVNTLSQQNGLASPSAIKSGQVLIIPGSGSNVASAAPRIAAAPVTPPPARQQLTTVQPVAAPAPAVVSTPAPAPQVQTVSAPVAAPSMQAAGEGFRWPVRGRVISSFGEKSNGTTNDGINIAVPEGTSVRAAENGVVIYSGSELEGFGNLVLVRHANDWVTAYAHNSELLVNRGDTISRGQVIARAGKTGNVNSPQLRFELRKGSNPVDPLKHLNAL